eukprot:212388-Rhodomonas_salina.2
MAGLGALGKMVSSCMLQVSAYARNERCTVLAQRMVLPAGRRCLVLTSRMALPGAALRDVLYLHCAFVQGSSNEGTVRQAG